MLLPSLLPRLVYYAARNGYTKTLCFLLHDQSEDVISHILNSNIPDRNQNCSPLIIAAKNGHDSVVKLLIQKFKVDVEHEGIIIFDNKTVHGATALWCAAVRGHLKVVRTLVKYVDINHKSQTGSTPLRAASFVGRVDMVSFLLDHNADINIANRFDSTCLMVASYHGHVDVVRLLIDRGADLNSIAKCGATAMHFAADLGHASIVKILIDKGAKILKNNSGMTPSLVAGDRSRRSIVAYFIKNQLCSRLEKIDAYEILGSSFANSTDNYDMTLTYKYLRLAMEERFRSGKPAILKSCNEPIEAYQNHVECQNMDELERIRNDHNALQMECLVLRERILGSSNSELSSQMDYRGSVFADMAQFDKCYNLWLHALKIRHDSNVVICRDLLKFVQLFSQMLYVGVEFPFHYILEVFFYALKTLEKGVVKLKNADPSDKDNLMEEHDSNILTMLYLLCIACKLLNYGSSDQTPPPYICTVTEEQRRQIMKLVYQLNQLRIRDSFNSTFLHLSINEDTFVDKFHVNDICKFPCAATSCLLIKCGADVNAFDSVRDTPLHIIAKYQHPITDFLNLHTIVTNLINHGAHLDCVNCDGKTPYEITTTGVTELILRNLTNICLKCSAARAIQKHLLPYKGLVPLSLELFIEMHGVHRL